MSNQDFFAASVNARRAALQREARAARVARQALRAGRRSAKAAGRQANAVAARGHARRPGTAPGGLNASAVCGN